MKKTGSSIVVFVLSAMLILSGCMASGEMSGFAAGKNGIQKEEDADTMISQNGVFPGDGSEPYVVRTNLKEYTAADPETGIGVYGRYTELVTEENAPDILKEAVADCNRRAEEAVRTYVDEHVQEAAPAGDEDPDAPEEIEDDVDVEPEEIEDITENEPETGGNTAGDILKNAGNCRFSTYAYIVNITRADDTAISILETELENSRADKPGSRVMAVYTTRFHAVTYDTQSGEEIGLEELTGEDIDQNQLIKDALYAAYGIKDMARISSSGFAWTADALGIRFFINSDAVPEDKRQEANLYGGWTVTATVPYTAMKGEKAAVLAKAPDDYIAWIGRETVYDLPGGDFSVMITEDDGKVFLRKIPDKGKTEDLIIEYADKDSAFYIIRSQGGFYLFRERIGYQEGFYYDFANPDGGFGRFAYQVVQYFDSFLREIDLTLPYNPKCVHMCEKRRSFGEQSYDVSSFIPHAHYSFPDQPKGRYKRFRLLDEGLSVDAYNVACRLREDFSAVRIDEEGNEQEDFIVKAGRALIFDMVTGEGNLYLPPPQRSNYDREFVYTCHLSDGTKLRFVSEFESTIFTGGAYMNRFTEPVSLWEAGFDTQPEPEKPFTVNIGGKEYTVIPDYSMKNHVGEEIDFGDESWWEVEGYTGSYEMTADDLKEMEGEYFTYDAASRPEGTVTMDISPDGHVVLNYYDEVFEGDLPEKRYYKTYPAIRMTSSKGWPERSFQIELREGKAHSRPYKIELYSEGLPATNEPSKVPPLMIYLTKNP